MPQRATQRPAPVTPTFSFAPALDDITVDSAATAKWTPSSPQPARPDDVRTAPCAHASDSAADSTFDSAVNPTDCDAAFAAAADPDNTPGRPTPPSLSPRRRPSLPPSPPVAAPAVILDAVTDPAANAVGLFTHKPYTGLCNVDIPAATVDERAHTAHGQLDCRPDDLQPDDSTAAIITPSAPFDLDLPDIHLAHIHSNIARTPSTASPSDPFMDGSTPPCSTTDYDTHYPAAPPTPSPPASLSSGGHAGGLRDLHRSLEDSSGSSGTSSDMPSL